MTPQARLQQAHQRSVGLYLRRQAAQEQLMQLQAEAQQIDRELIALDGEIRVWTQIAAQEPA